MSSPLGGAMPPPVYDPYTMQVGGNLTESIHTLLTEREGSMFDNALAAYYRRKSVKMFVETLHIVLNTNAKRQLLIPIRDAYIKASDVPRFNELVVSLGLAASTLHRKKKAKSKDGSRGGSPMRSGTVVVDVKKDSKGENGFIVRGGSEGGVGIFVSWVDPGSSADKSGLQVGDQILMANDTSFESINHYEAAEIINRNKKLRLWVLPNVKVTSSRAANAAFTWVDAEGKHTSPPVPEEQHSERTIRLTVTKGKNLGISIRGGSQHGLGIYISVVEEGSVAWEEGLKKGDQIIDVNGLSFMNIRHSDAVRVLRSNRTMAMKLRDVGKLPYTKIVPFNDKKWHNTQGATFPRTAQRQASESPPVVRNKHDGRMSPVRGVMESLAMTVLTHPELTSFKKLVYLYEHQELDVEEFANGLLKLLNHPEKLRLLSEVKTIIAPDDLNTFNELTVRKELEAKKAMKANGAGTGYAEAVSHTLPKQSSKTHKYKLHIGDDDDDDDTMGPLNGYVSEDLDELENRTSSRALRAAGSLDDIPQRLSPSGIPSFLKPPPPPTSTSENVNEDNPLNRQWSESSLQSSGISKNTPQDPSVPSLKAIRQWTENGEAPLAANIEARVRNEMELKLRKEFEEKERIKGEELKKQLLEEQRRREESIKAEKEALQKKIKEIEENAKQEAEAKLRQQLEEQERKLLTRVHQEQQEKLQAERKAAEQRVKEAEERAKRELEHKTLKEVEERMKAEYETRVAQEAARFKETVAKSGEVEKKIRQELEAKMHLEYEHKLHEELGKRAEEERKGKEHVLLVNKGDEVARLEAEEEARMAMEERIRHEAEAKIRAEYEARLQRETQEKVRLAEEVKVHKAAEARLQKENETGNQKQSAGLDLLKKPIEKKPKAEEAPLRKQVQVTGENERPSVLKKPTEKKPKVEDVKTSDENEEPAMQVRTAEEDLKQREEADAAQQKKEEEKRKKDELQRKREENLRKREQEKKTGGAQQEGKKTQLPKVETESLMEVPVHKDDLEKEQHERDEQERAEREKVDEELARRQKADKERTEQRQKERENAEREKAEREKAEREKAEREKAEQEKAEREKAEREKASEREKAEREKAEREKAEQEKAKREKAERERELKLQKEREDAERKRIETQKQQESDVAEQKRLAAEEMKSSPDNARKVAFNVKHVPVNFGSDAPAIKTKQQLVEEERQKAQETLNKKLQDKLKQQSLEGSVGAVQLRDKLKQQSLEGSVGAVQLRDKTKPAPKPESAVPKPEPAAPKVTETVPKAEPLTEEALDQASTGGFSYAGYDHLHGRLDTIKVIKFTKKLGFAIDGGANTKQKAVLIREIIPDGCAASTKLHVGHQILEVNGSSVYGLKHRDVVMNIKDAFEGPLNKTIEFVVLEREPTS